MEKIIILGHGGHAKSLADAIEREGKYQIAGYIVNDASIELDKTDYPIIGDDYALAYLYKSGIHYAAIGIGYLGKGNIRNKLYEQLKTIGYSLPVICDPSAILSKKVEIGEGTFIGKGTVINTGVTVGKACIINTGAIVEHDCSIGDFSHIAVGTILCGGVSVGESVFIGANATVVQEITIGNSTIIGAGTVLLADADEKCTLVGNPGRIVKRC